MKIVVSGDTYKAAEQIRDFFSLRQGISCILPKNPTSGPFVASIVEHERPELLILDVDLGQVDGIGVLGSLRRKGYSGRAVLMASEITPKLCEAARSLHVERILPKPFELTELGELLMPSIFAPHLARISASDPLYSLLRSAGLPAKFYGTAFLQEAICEAIENPALLHRMTTELYPELARRFGSLPSRVERCMRSAIEFAWRRGDPILYCSVLGYCNDGYHGKPCNSEFIAAFAQYLSIWENYCRTGVQEA